MLPLHPSPTSAGNEAVTHHDWLVRHQYWWPDGLQSSNPHLPLPPPHPAPTTGLSSSSPPPTPSSLLQGRNDQHSWGRGAGGAEEQSCQKFLLIPSHPAKGFGLRDKVNSCPNVLTSDLFSVFRLASTDRPVSHPSFPTKMLMSLAQT